MAVQLFWDTQIGDDLLYEAILVLKRDRFYYTVLSAWDSLVISIAGDKRRRRLFFEGNRLSQEFQA